MEEIVKGIQSKDVCPHCGNDVFAWVRNLSEVGLFNSNREPVSIYLTQPIIEPGEGLYKPICNNCQHDIGGFVTPSFFYETVCDESFEDSMVHFIHPEKLFQTQAMMTEEYLTMNPEFQTYSVAAISSPLGWLLMIELIWSETSKHFHLMARIVTHEMATETHVKTVSHPGVVVEVPSAVAGRYVFILGGKRYAVHVLEEQFDLDPVMTYDQMSALMKPEQATTATIVVPEGMSYEQAVDLAWVTHQVEASLEALESKLDEDLKMRIVMDIHDNHESVDQDIAWRVESYLQELVNKGMKPVTYGNTKGNEQDQQEDLPLWTLISYSPGGTVENVFQTQDDRRMKQVVEGYIKDGYDKDNLVLLPTVQRINIDEFLKEG